MNIAKDFEAMLADVIDDTGVSLRKSAKDLALYAAERAEHLKGLVNDAGFRDAVRAERDAIALQAGIHAVANADLADARIVGAIHGGLSLAARALAIV